MFWPVVICDDVFWMSFGSWKTPCSLDLSCPAGRVNPRLSRKPITDHSNDGRGQNLSNAPIRMMEHETNTSLTGGPLCFMMIFMGITGLPRDPSLAFGNRTGGP